MNVGILKTDDVRVQWVEQFGEYPDMFAALLQGVDSSLKFVTYDVLRQHYPENIDEMDAYLITGSQFSAYDDHPWIHQLCQFIQQLAKREKKLVGICFGHQIIAHSLGGETQKSDKGWGVGVHAVQMARSEQSFRLLVSHQDQVVEPAKGATILAGSDFCPIAICQLGDHIMTFQGHPEFDPEYARELLNLRRDMYPDEVYQQALASLDGDIDQQLIAQWIVDFIRH